jgi:Protein of unknown function (DUF2637)
VSTRYRRRGRHEFIKLIGGLVLFAALVTVVKLVQSGVLPWLASGLALWAGWRAARWTARRHAVVSWPRRAIEGKPLDPDTDRTETVRLRNDNAKLRAKVRALSDMVNGPEARAMTADKDRYRTATAVAVLLVAAIAATVSFVHIESLAVRYGQPRLAAWLLPLSIDGTVAVSSLAMLRSARAG